MGRTVQRQTPGVYITELASFPPSVVSVQTAIPAFIGYTEKSESNGKSIIMTPTPIYSLADYTSLFGAGFKPLYSITALDATATSYDFSVKQTDGSIVKFKLTQVGASEFNLYDSLRLFYANGGGAAYVVSVGDYTASGTVPTGVTIDATKLVAGLEAVKDQNGPTMLVVPDAVLLAKEADFYSVTDTMLAQCGKTQSRMAVLDVWSTQTLSKVSTTDAIDAVITSFREKIGSKNLSYGMAYFPFLATSIVKATEVDYCWLQVGDATQFAILRDQILAPQAAGLYGKYDAEGELDTDKEPYKSVMAMVDQMPTTTYATSTADAVATLDQNVINALPILGQIEDILCDLNNTLPPSGAMAGIYTYVDANRGVWNAPANISLASVIGPTVLLSDDQQADLNVPLDGKAIDAIRNFPGRGNLVWGARTLDGNSADYRYIQVRRTLIYVEQSIKSTLNQFVFAANDGNTWVTVTSMISNFLQQLWSQGGLMGATSSEAFTVQCGLGSTMTAQDILDGYMVVQITLQMIHPAEFIELTFKQTMGGGA